MKDTKKMKYKSNEFTKVLVTTVVLSNTLLTPISTLAATNTGSADVATTLNDAEDCADLQKRLNKGDLLKNSLPNNEVVEEDRDEENLTVEESSSENVGEKKEENKVEATVLEVKESTNNEVDSNEKATKSHHQQTLNGVTYSWVYDSGVVVMDVRALLKVS